MSQSLTTPTLEKVRRRSFWRWVPLILILLALLLPAFPPFIGWALHKGFALTGIQGRFDYATGYLFNNVTLHNADLTKPESVGIKAERVSVEFNVFRLMQHEMHVKLFAKNGNAKINWDEAIPVRRSGPEGSGPGFPFKLFVDRMSIENVSLELNEGKRFPIPQMKVDIKGEGPNYDLLVSLPGGKIRGKVSRPGREFESWDALVEGDLTAFKHWYPEFEAGSFTGHWVAIPSGINLENQIKDGKMRVLNFDVSKVSGPLDFDGRFGHAVLKGFALGSPITAVADLDVSTNKPFYKFDLEGNPTLGEVAKAYGMNFPFVVGSGPLRLHGEGWDKIVVNGNFTGKGSLVQEPMTYAGNLSFDKVFKLTADLDGHWYDRSLKAVFSSEGNLYRANLSDSRGSQLVLTGEGNQTKAKGKMWWPKPLGGFADVIFSSKGAQWTLDSISKDVELSPAKPFDLSGRLLGDGNRVNGKLGTLGLSGTWDDLDLKLGKTPLVVGELAGAGGMRKGQIALNLNFDSPYTNFPIAVRQDKKIWNLTNDWLDAKYQDKVFGFTVKELPIRLGQEFKLNGSGKLVDSALQGGWTLNSTNVRVKGNLRDLGTDFSGTVLTPLKNLPLEGTADSKGLFANLGRTTRISADKSGLRVRGPLEVGWIDANSDLTLKDAKYSGQISLNSPYWKGLLVGEGNQLVAHGSGYAQLDGPVAPVLGLKGRLTVPLKGAFQIESVPLSITKTGVTAPKSSLEFKAGMPFDFSLPVLVSGRSGQLRAWGGLEKGQWNLTTPYGTVAGTGPWTDQTISGPVSYSGITGDISGKANIFKARYDLRLESKKLEGGMDLSGVSSRAKFNGSFQKRKLTVTGGFSPATGGAGGLTINLRANQFSLSAFGQPKAYVTGNWSDNGGRLELNANGSQATLSGDSLLGEVEVVATTPYGSAKGTASTKNVDLAIKLAHKNLTGNLRLFGPPATARLSGGGTISLPSLEKSAWKIDGSLDGQRWRLSGPVNVSGAGAKYAGDIRWPYTVSGKSGTISGSFSGNGAVVSAKLYTNLLGKEIRFNGGSKNTSLAGVYGSLSYPKGEISILNEKITTKGDAEFLASIFGAKLSGPVSGEVNFAGKGSLTGKLLSGKTALDLSYKDLSASIMVPAQDAGIRATKTSKGFEIAGLGKATGLVSIADKVSGTLELDNSALFLSAAFYGTRELPKVIVSSKGKSWSASGSGAYEFSGSKVSGSFDLQQEMASAHVDVVGTVSDLRASGTLQTDRYLRQSGKLQGRYGSKGWTLEWDAPLSLSATGRGAVVETALVKGKQLLEIGARTAQLEGDLSYQDGVFSGLIGGNGDDISLLAKGDGGKVNISGKALGAGIQANINAKGLLGGDVSYQRKMLTSDLSASGSLDGSVFAPKLLAKGNLQGEGERIAIDLVYDKGIFAHARGPDLAVDFNSGSLILTSALNLKPFTGQDITFTASGSGDYKTMVLPIKLTGPVVQASGTIIPGTAQVTLEGTASKQNFTLKNQDGIKLALNGPFLVGEAGWAAGKASGNLSLDLPMMGGGLKGVANLDSGVITLNGRDGIDGTLRAELKNGWANPLDWNVAADLDGLIGIHGALELNNSLKSTLGTVTVNSKDYGSVMLEGLGSKIDITGLDSLGPLTASMTISPLSVKWAYKGDLPKGLGTLEGSGVYPGHWVSANSKTSLGPIKIEGDKEGFLVTGQGLVGQYDLTKANLEVSLNHFKASSTELTGKVSGPISNLVSKLEWSAFGRNGEIDATWSDSVLTAILAGDINGNLKKSKYWTGKVSAKEGSFSLSGESWIPVLDGKVSGIPISLRYPILQISNSSDPFLVNLTKRSAEGTAKVLGLSLLGEGDYFSTSYPIGNQGVFAETKLSDFSTSLFAGEDSEGKIIYDKNGFSGQLKAKLMGVDLVLTGKGSELGFSGAHANTDWLPWEKGFMAGTVDLKGVWGFAYNASGDGQTIRGDGKLANAKLSAEGKWVSGQLSYDQNWAGKFIVDLPLAPIQSQIKLQLEGKGDLVAVGQLEGSAGKVDLSAQVSKSSSSGRATFKELSIGDMPYLNSKIKYLKGRASGEVSWNGSAAEFKLTGPSLTVEGDDEALGLSVNGKLENGVTKAKINFSSSLNNDALTGGLQDQHGNSDLDVTYSSGIISGNMRAARFPLHWLISAWAGRLEGKAFWTGQTGFSVNTRDIWKSNATFVGEKLSFDGGGDSLKGSAVLRLEKERVYVDKLDLSGKGTWSGSGYYGRNGSNLSLNLERTSFTPILQIIPSLRPFSPDADGTVKLTSTGSAFDLDLEDFNFKLGAVKGSTKKSSLHAGESVAASGKLTLTAPYPAEAELSAEGNLSEFLIKLAGQADVPLLSPNEPWEASVSYPYYILDMTLLKSKARMAGPLLPLNLTLSGELPVRYPSLYLLDGYITTDGLNLRYEEGKYRLKGWVDVTNAKLGIPEKREPILPSDPKISVKKKYIPFEFENVQLHAERGILVQESLLQGELRGDLFLNGDYASPYLTGEVTPIRGTFKLWNHDFQILDPNGTIPVSAAVFSATDGLYPQIEAYAETVVVDRAISETNPPRVRVRLSPLSLHFQRQNLKTKWILEYHLTVLDEQGNPARKGGNLYTDEEASALLLVERSDISALEGLQSGVISTGIQGAVQTFFLGQLESEFAKALGLDFFRIETPALIGGDLVDTTFKFGITLSPEWSLGYSLGFNGAQQGSLQYRTDGFSLSASAGLASFSDSSSTDPSRVTYLNNYHLEAGWNWPDATSQLTFTISNEDFNPNTSTDDSLSFGIGWRFSF